MNEQERQEFLMDMRESMKIESEVLTDPVARPAHYQSEDGMEAIDVIKAFVPDPHSYYMGNVLKYVMRHLQKNGKQDLQKARWYLDEMIEEYDA
jgi:hypothetical protein